MAGTIKEIAEKAGVSRGTVDRALNNRGRINPEVAEKIHQIAAEIGYVPRSRKQEVPKYKIGIVTQLASSSFMVPIHQGLQDAIRELGNRNIECILKEVDTVDEAEQIKALDQLLAEKVQAIAIMPVESPLIREKINQLVDQGIRVVTFNSDIVGTKRSCFIGLNNHQSGKTAAGLMGMLTGGEGKVLAITGYFGNSVSSSRVDGFVEEIKQSYSNVHLVGVQSSFDDSQEVENNIVSTIKAFPDLTGIVVFSGGQAGIERAFERLNLEKRPFVIIYDNTSRNKAALEKGVVDFLIDQDGYTQGYRSLLLLADQLQNHSSVTNEFMYTDIIIKTKYNI
ncbi:LacI family DNA-binding transcriptional regulator [Enterococcus sp. 669A]|uniref:LacI family DNA-binding transcriptional regulator n=1 Tax=Candidatus Enterococcus moelleringii TaxID=2815325 RepID=A0ABS3LBU1_9ENTE|nr:LacI family DNA-binding transcriptional regulator [Enterococcus sp. 669A]MBO1307100.1 LacI family DNA-binding transcriptional regulator [Enterococcus sp. 669A]